MDISEVAGGREGHDGTAQSAGSQDGVAIAVGQTTQSGQSARARRGLLIVISGPSGVGKDLLVARMRAARPGRHYAVTATTRGMRAGELDGVDYHFVGKSRFEDMIGKGELLEWALVYGNYYGVPRAQVEEALAGGRDVVVKIDVQGAATIRGIAPDGVFVFLAPPSREELRRRLMGRGSDRGDALERRLAAADREMSEAVKFDCVVAHGTNRTDEALEEVEACVERARRMRDSSV